MKNPIMQKSSRPEYQKITPLNIKEATIKQLKNCEEIYAEVISTKDINWQNTIEKIELHHNQLSETNCILFHLSATMNSNEIREIQTEIQPLISQHYTDFLQNKEIYKIIQHFQKEEQQKLLNQEQKTAIQNYVQSFFLSGIELNQDDKKTLKDILTELNLLSLNFSNNILDSTQKWHKHIENIEELQGLPESFLEKSAEHAKQEGKSGWLLDISMPSYVDLITYSKNRELRKEIYTAYNKRAYSNNAEENFDNSENIITILKKRYQISKLLKFENYSQKSIATKLAKNNEEVLDFIEMLFDKSKNKAEKEIETLKKFMKNKKNDHELEAWDVSFYSEQMKKDNFEYDTEQIKEYFEVEHVVKGMIQVTEKLFDIKIVSKTIPEIWHEDVKYFEIYNNEGTLQGGIYMDLYVRKNKKNGAWVSVAKNRIATDEKVIQYPIANLICNFECKTASKPSLLRHQEVTTLFHEFGHALHHISTKVNVVSVSGINSLPLDAVEVPSQFLENWCYQEEVLNIISKHYQTQEPLPKEHLDKIIAVKNYQSGLHMIRQLEFALFDFSIHCNYKEQKSDYIQKCINQIKSKTKGIPHPKFNKFQNSFSHIFAGCYAAGYYSYKWSEVMAADAFGRFEEEGVLSQTVGKEFFDKVLAKSGSENFMDLFKEFRGREPKIDFLLKHSGIN